MSQSELKGERDGRDLRRRRAQILRDKKEDARVKLIIKDTISNNQYSKHMLKTFLVVATTLLCTIGAVINHTRPKFIKRFWKDSIPTFHLATRYPNNVILNRDLPRFFGHYSIATPENVLAQAAVQKVLRSRRQLHRRAGRIKSMLKVWDDSNVEHLLRQGLCGDDFELAHRRASSQQTKDDLLMWCLLASLVTEGYFMESVEILDSALFLTRNRGIVVRKQPPAGIADGYGALSTKFYLHPRTDKNNTAIDWIPTKILAMLIPSSKDEIEKDLNDLAQRMLYELIVTQGHEKEYLILEEVCQENRPERAIAYDTGEDPSGCYFVVPEKYGGNFSLTEDE